MSRKQSILQAKNADWRRKKQIIEKTLMVLVACWTCTWNLSPSMTVFTFNFFKLAMLELEFHAEFLCFSYQLLAICTLPMMEIAQNPYKCCSQRILLQMRKCTSCSQITQNSFLCVQISHIVKWDGDVEEVVVVHVTPLSNFPGKTL